MGANGAVKCLKVVNNLQTVLAIEMITASQALWFREPNQTGTRLRPMLEAFRKVVPPVEKDRILHDDIVAATEFLENWPL